MLAATGLAAIWAALSILALAHVVRVWSIPV